MLWVIVFLLNDSPLISVISKLEYLVFIKVKDHVQSIITNIDKIKSMGLLSWCSNHLCKKTSLNSKWINFQIKNNTTTKQLYAFILYKWLLILIKLPSNALILLTTGKIIGGEGLGELECGLIILVSFLKKKTSRQPCAMLFLEIYFSASLTMPTLRKSHP